MEIRCVKGMHRLKLVSSEDNSVFKGLKGSGKTRNDGNGNGMEMDSSLLLAVP